MSCPISGVRGAVTMLSFLVYIPHQDSLLRNTLVNEVTSSGVICTVVEMESPNNIILEDESGIRYRLSTQLITPVIGDTLIVKCDSIADADPAQFYDIESVAIFINRVS